MEHYTRSRKTRRTGFVTTSNQYTQPYHMGPMVTTTNVVSMTSSDTLSGYRNTSWKSQVRNHDNATTPLDASTRLFRWKRTDYHSVENRNPPYYPSSPYPRQIVNDVSGVIGKTHEGVSQTPPTEDATVANAAVIGFLKKIRAQQRRFQGGVALGELRETLHMIRNPAMALRRRAGSYLDFLQQSRNRRSRRNPKWVADSWLEHSFGWQPLLNDIDDGARLLAEKGRLYQEEYSKVRFSARGEKSSGPVRDEPVSVGAQPRMNLRQQSFEKDRTQVRYLGAVRIKSAGTSSIDPELLGFSLNDFVPTVWELIPWSFLIDYFTNIGDVLEAWTTCTSNLAWCNRTSRREHVYRSNIYADIQQTAAGWWQGNGCKGRLWGTGGWVEVVDRQVVRSIGLTDSPSIAFELPGLGVKWINMTALLSSRRNLRN